jgi:hypothetical protein
MPFLLLRTVSVLATGFLLAGPSASSPGNAGSALGRQPAAAVTPCPAHWGGGQQRVPSGLSPAGSDSQIMSIATLSPSDVWMLIKGTDNNGNNVSAVYHRAGSEWRESANLAGNDATFGSQWIVARSDTDVWVIGSARRALKTWHYDGSRWTDHPPTRYSFAAINAVALGTNGVLYLAGSIGNIRKGIILGYDGARWVNLAPANRPQVYKALAVTADGTLIAAGGGRNDGTLQERSGITWTTVSLSAPVTSITSVSVAPGGTVYGAGVAAGDQPVLIEQRVGSRSATVVGASAVDPGTTSTHKTRVAALGLDVWLLGVGEPHAGWHHPWFIYDDSEFSEAWHRFSRPGIGLAGADPRSGRPCWSTAVPRALLDSESPRGRCHGGRSHHRGVRRSGCRCPGESLLQKDSGLTW